MFTISLMSSSLLTSLGGKKVMFFFPKKQKQKRPQNIIWCLLNENKSTMIFCMMAQLECYVAWISIPFLSLIASLEHLGLWLERTQETQGWVKQICFLFLFLKKNMSGTLKNSSYQILWSKPGIDLSGQMSRAKGIRLIPTGQRLSEVTGSLWQSCCQVIC